MDEFSFIKQFVAPLSQAEQGAEYLLNDAALLTPTAGNQLVITKDILIENTHFLPHTPPQLLAKKLLRVNLSDLAAMGATPRAYLLGLGLTENSSTPAWLEAFAAGLAEDQEAYHITLIGGDTTRHEGNLLLSLTALGEVPTDKALPRRGSHIGDDIYVSGTLGDSALGLLTLQGQLAQDDYLAQRYHLPEPRITLGIALREHANAMMDISDGLAQDITHMLEDSQGAQIDCTVLPLSHAAQNALKKTPSLLNSILSGGDDYELLFTAPSNKRHALMALENITRIGKITGDGNVTFIQQDGKEMHLSHKGYKHF